MSEKYKDGDSIGTAPEGAFFTLVDDKRYPPELWMWDGEGGWTNNLNNCIGCKTVAELNDLWVAASAQDIESQPAMIDQVPFEIKEGVNAGKWAIEVKVYFINKTPKIRVLE